MNEQQIAKAYAKSLIELADEKNLDIADELITFNDMIRQSNDLETLMFLDVFTIEEKKSVVCEVIEKLELSQLLKHFVEYLMDEKRIGIFPLIFKEVIVIDDHKKGFLRGVIEGSETEVSDEVKAKLVAHLEGKLGTQTKLEYEQNKSISAGFRVTVGDLQLDASVDNQLTKLKETIITAKR